MKHHVALGLSLAGLLVAAGAWAQTTVLGPASAVRPDGGTQTWYPNDGHTEISQPDGATAEVNREGKVTKTGAAKGCENAVLQGDVGERRECRKGSDGKIRAYIVHYVSYTCRNAPQARRIIVAFVETNAGPPCTEEDYNRDMKSAASTWGETWMVPGQTTQKKGKAKLKKAAKSPPARKGGTGTATDGGGGPDINIGIGIGGGGGERGRRERRERKDRDVGTFGR